VPTIRPAGSRPGPATGVYSMVLVRITTADGWIMRAFKRSVPGNGSVALSPGGLMRLPVRLFVVLCMLVAGVGLAPSLAAADDTPVPPDAHPDAARMLAGDTLVVPVLANDLCGPTAVPCRPRRVSISITSKLPDQVSAVVQSKTGSIKVRLGATRRAGPFTLNYLLTDRATGLTDSTGLRVRVVYPTFSPVHFTPAAGARFNDPEGNRAARRNIIRNVTRTIDSVRGYRVESMRQCPRDPAFAPNEIKISLYSIADRAFVDALIRAARRCVSVQLLMNNHLDARTSPSWGKLLHAIGGDRSARNFTYRCASSCRGHGVLHSKFYLFSKAGTKKDIVMVGSSNMTTNAARVQWNDLYTTSDNATLYDQFRRVFEEMVPDKYVANPLRVFDAGRYQTVFWPQPGATAQDDQVMNDLRSIKCSGATGGAGINGHTAVYLNIHAWHSAPRGLYLAQQVRQLWQRGCYVNVLYSFMGHGIFRVLKDGTGPRMVVLRTLFPHPFTDVAEIYSHMKNIAVSGNVAGRSDSWVTWTGSNNFTNMGVHSDEVMMRIPSRYVFNQYRAHWQYIARTRSSPVWAIYQEPSGGGRAPVEDERAARFDVSGRSGTPAYAGARTTGALPQVDTTGQDMD
jgi:hypothetical protein